MSGPEKTIGQVTFEAYCQPIPAAPGARFRRWEDLGLPDRAAWEVAGTAAAYHMAGKRYVVARGMLTGEEKALLMHSLRNDVVEVSHRAVEVFRQLTLLPPGGEIVEASPMLPPEPGVYPVTLESGKKTCARWDGQGWSLWVAIFDPPCWDPVACLNTSVVEWRMP